jgi:hypothetical protein
MPIPTNYTEGWLRDTIEAAAGCPAYPLAVPEGVLPPFVMYGQAGQEDLQTLDEGFGSVTLVQGTYSVSICADGYLQAKQLARLIRAALRNFTGVAGDLKIHESAISGQQDGDAVFLEGRDVPTYIVEQTYAITWEE